jgi:hypothetical protein
MTVGLRWEATGTAGGLFPMLDADISISPAGEGTSPAGKESARLALSGTYRPPLRRLGAGLDRVIMSRVATATFRSLLRSVADTVASPATAGQPSKDTNPRSRSTAGVSKISSTSLPHWSNVAPQGMKTRGGGEHAR